MVIAVPGIDLSMRDPYNYRKLVEQALDLGVPVVLSSQIPIHMGHLNAPSIAPASEYGALQVFNHTQAATWTKIAWAIGCAHEEEKLNPNLRQTRMARLREKLEINYVGEVLGYHRTELKKPPH